VSERAGDTVCSYVHDVSGDRFDDIEGEQWRCRVRALEDCNRCPFHLTDEEQQARGVTPTQVGERLVSFVSTGSSAQNRILGLRCPGIDIEYRVIDGQTNHPVDLRESIIDGEVRADEADIHQRLVFDHSEFVGEVSFHDTDFKREASFSDARFESRAEFNIATFRSWADFSEATFVSQAMFRGATFQKGLFGVEMSFHDAADFMSAQFMEVANLYESTFEHGGLFSSTRFEKDAKFIGCECRGPTLVGENFIDDPSLESSDLEYGDGEISGTSLILHGAVCNQELEFQHVTVDAGISVIDTRVDGDIQVENVSSVGPDSRIEFVEVDSVTGRIHLTPEVDCDLSESVIGETDLGTAGDDTVDMTSFNFKNATFDGFDFGTYKQSFEECDWTLPADDLTPFERENVYLRAKNGAAQTGESAAAREFHLREMKSRGDGYLYELLARGPGGAGSSPQRAFERIGYLRKWLTNQFLRFTCGYGERPSRVVYSSLFVIVLYAAIYSLLGVKVVYRGSLSTLAFSFEVYNALILGLPEVSSSAIGTLVATEAFLGPFFIALFVFSITQSLAR